MKLYLTLLICCSQFASAYAVEPRPSDWPIFNLLLSFALIRPCSSSTDQNGMAEIGARRKVVPEYRSGSHTQDGSQIRYCWSGRFNRIRACPSSRMGVFTGAGLKPLQRTLKVCASGLTGCPPNTRILPRHFD